MFDLDFTETFFFGKGYDYYTLPEPSETPTCVLQALVSMHPDDWAAYCLMVLEVHGDAECTLSDAMGKVREVCTCTSPRSPVEVWLDPEGDWRVLVYDHDRA